MHRNNHLENRAGAWTCSDGGSSGGGSFAENIAMLPITRAKTNSSPTAPIKTYFIGFVPEIFVGEGVVCTGGGT